MTSQKSKELNAAEEYLRRKLGISHPQGRWDGSRWYLADDECSVCCIGIRPPSAKWPYSQRDHGRTLKHVAQLYRVNEMELRECLVRVQVIMVAKALMWLKDRGVVACPPNGKTVLYEGGGTITMATDDKELALLVRLKF